MRKSTFFLLYLSLNLILAVLMVIHAYSRQRAETVRLRANIEIVRVNGITDLCLFTEASYTRHLTQTDLHTPFQDGPFSLEHFPSGALVRPPQGLKRMNEKLD
ncbi:MAG: hypothetical protein OEW18_12000 [Candidatus Aminicenantes bacterium]|nr:hypothetical protein [Candidatus Aminicenantes bacterium]